MAWTAGLCIALALRYDFAFDPTPLGGGGLLLLVPLTVAVQYVTGVALGLYLGRWRYGSLEELAVLVRAVAAVTVVIALLNRFLFDRLVPVSVTLAAGVIAFVLMAGSRYVARLVDERHLRPSPDGARRVLVFGAGEAGGQTVAAMMRGQSGRFVPVALLDDDPAKRHLEVRGVRVVGDRTSMEAAAREYRADTLLVAVPSAGPVLVGVLSRAAARAGLEVRVLPPVDRLLGARPAVSDIRPLAGVGSTETSGVDVEIDETLVADYLADRRVLVTGAGGVIGSELCRQVHGFGPAALVMLDRDETRLHGLQLSIEGHALLDSDHLVVCDIRDPGRLERIFEQHRPEVVFHAAVLTRHGLLERTPAEAVKTNVWGLRHVLDVARRHGVGRLVHMSTDKAVDPVGVVGRTARVAERLVSRAAGPHHPFVSVRLGGPAERRSSPLEHLRAQIERGGPVTIPDPDATRYLFPVGSSARVALLAGAIGEPGQALAVDLGDPVRVGDLARRAVRDAGADVAIVTTGLQPGERLHEALLARDERDRRPRHPLVAQVPVVPLTDAEVEALAAATDPATLVAALERACAPAGQRAVA